MSWWEIYLLIGVLTYPTTLDMWYRVNYKRQEWYAPHQVQWYLGFVLYVLSWVVMFPVLVYKARKELDK